MTASQNLCESRVRRRIGQVAKFCDSATIPTTTDLSLYPRVASKTASAAEASWQPRQRRSDSPSSARTSPRF